MPWEVCLMERFLLGPGLHNGILPPIPLCIGALLHCIFVRLFSSAAHFPPLFISFRLSSSFVFQLHFSFFFLSTFLPLFLLFYLSSSFYLAMISCASFYQFDIILINFFPLFPFICCLISFIVHLPILFNSIPYSTSSLVHLAPLFIFGVCVEGVEIMIKSRRRTKAGGKQWKSIGLSWRRLWFQFRLFVLLVGFGLGQS